MRAKEFVKEDAPKKIRKATQLAMPSGRQMDDLDQYYGYYRLGIAMAGAPDQGTPTEGPAKDVPTIWAYTDGDEEIAKKAIKNQGKSGKNIVKSGPSRELPDTNTVSPVAKWM